MASNDVRVTNVFEWLWCMHWVLKVVLMLVMGVTGVVDACDKHCDGCCRIWRHCPCFVLTTSSRQKWLVSCLMFFTVHEPVSKSFLRWVSAACLVCHAMPGVQWRTVWLSMRQRGIQIQKICSLLCHCLSWRNAGGWHTTSWYMPVMYMKKKTKLTNNSALASGTSDAVQLKILVCDTWPCCISAGNDAFCIQCSELGNVSEQLFCTSCGQHYHGNCLCPPVEIKPIVRAGWQCPNCKICQTCRSVTLTQMHACTHTHTHTDTQCHDCKICQTCRSATHTHGVSWLQDMSDLQVSHTQCVS